MNKFKKLIFVYSEVFFSDSLLLGGIIAVVTLLDLNAGLCGILAVLSAYIFSKLTFSKKMPLESYYYYNPLLVGLSVGVLFKLSLLTLLLVFSAGILSIVLTITFGHFMKKYAALPVLSIPFVIVSGIVYLAAMKVPGFLSACRIEQIPAEYLNMPAWLSGYFASLASIFFSKSVLAGVILAVALFLHSRIVFLLSLIGYYAGALILGFFASSVAATYSDTNYFNYMLIAIAVGGVYLIPSIKAYLVSVFAVIIAYLILVSSELVFNMYNLPVFTLPFNITVLLFIYYTDIMNVRLRTVSYRKTPEENLDNYINYTKRFGEDLPSISLPFSGEWKVSQAFEDDVTHKGIWKYGVDFILTDEKDRQFEGNPGKPESFFAYSKPVLSPVSGTVAAAVNDISDNEIGSVNRENNWGNNVIIYDNRGFYVKICHLKKNSVVLKAGMYVEAGQLIGYCGNSGYSPFPHIHIHIQKDLGKLSGTQEYRFEQVVTDGGKFANKLLPVKGQILSALFESVKKKKVFELIMKDSFEFSFLIKYPGKKAAEQREKVEVVMDENGFTYLKNRKAKLYFETHKNVFRFYRYSGPKDSLLRYIFLALPSLPLSEYRLLWKDFLPLDISVNSVYKNIILFLQSFFSGISNNNVNLSYIDNSTLESSNTVSFLGRTPAHYDCRIKIHDQKFIQELNIKTKDTEILIKREKN
ncbi:MAG: urea transporter [Candidatus Firestonebacteria bacterium]